MNARRIGRIAIAVTRFYLVPLGITAAAFFWIVPQEKPEGETVSFNDGSLRCGLIAVSPHADKFTLSAALRDASTIVASAGCVNVRFDESIPPHAHDRESVK